MGSMTFPCISYVRPCLNTVIVDFWVFRLTVIIWYWYTSEISYVYQNIVTMIFFGQKQLPFMKMKSIIYPPGFAQGFWKRAPITKVKGRWHSSTKLGSIKSPWCFDPIYVYICIYVYIYIYVCICMYISSFIDTMFFLDNTISTKFLKQHISPKIKGLRLIVTSGAFCLTNHLGLWTYMMYRLISLGFMQH